MNSLQAIAEEPIKEPDKASVGDLDFKDDGNIEMVLRILGLMCDNQCRGIQVSLILHYCSSD